MGLTPLGPGWIPLLDRASSLLGAGDLLGEAARRQLAELLDLVVEWNRRTNLTAARSADELVDLVIADAAVIARTELSDAAPDISSEACDVWLDVGSGMGAPGLPLALLLAETRMRLVEPRQKRAAFLRATIARLALSRVEVHQLKSSALDDESADMAVSRATFPPAQWLAEGTRLATRGVWVLLAHDPAPAIEGWLPVRDLEYRWPLTGGVRRALRYAPEAGMLNRRPKKGQERPGGES